MKKTQAVLMAILTALAMLAATITMTGCGNTADPGNFTVVGSGS